MRLLYHYIQSYYAEYCKQIVDIERENKVFAFIPGLKSEVFPLTHIKAGFGLVYAVSDLSLRGGHIESISVAMASFFEASVAFGFEYSV